MLGARPVGSTAFQANNAREQKPRWDWRLILLRLCVLLCFTILLAQLWRLQIVEGHSFRQLADVNRFRVSPMPPPRGVVYDRNQRIVASNTPSFLVSVVPAALPKEETDRVYLELSGLLGMSPMEITDRVKKRQGDDYTPVVIKTDVERDVVLRVEQRRLRLPGVLVLPESSRHYPYGSLLSHILGYRLPITEERLAEMRVDEEAGYRPDDRIGVAGIEATYERELRGKPGKKLYEVDANERPLNDIRIDSPQPGHNLTLTIDLDLQRDVEAILKAGMGVSESAVAIVMDPRNGEILAMISAPSYDNNLFSGRVKQSDLEALLNDPRKPMINYAISGTFPPGSTFKLVTGAAALQEGVAHADTEITCEGALLVPNQYNPAISQRLPCWGVHGREDFVRGLANSCDVYYWTIAGGHGDFKGLGNERLASYARLMGYGAPTGIDIPGEVAGLVPTDQWKRATWGEPWLTGDTYNMGIGQGFVLSTPLQVAHVTNSVANGGRLLQPRLVAAISDSEDRPIRALDPVETGRIPISEANLALVRRGMQEVLLNEDVRKVNIPELKIAGKTGTAEFPGIRDDKGILPTHGWFTAYAPYDNPEVSVTVFLQRGGGPTNAAPVAVEIIKRYFRYSPPKVTATPTRDVQPPR